ncbi:hypothetical protein [Lactobacillus bombicola]|uniref:Uncharacterized protein n=1 Tax=Lactobacillus bombicola TaxID=1505723 RepID=A0ABX9LWM5_9LACO|nr:hypothetical protein [Lactobacillus bombicola]RHW49003.1 hypothetical protein DS833_05730 [Lactobacillus bombicola]RHW53552.1 hypothetical protein DS834_01035 [Lactobacillus bombicola]
MEIYYYSDPTSSDVKLHHLEMQVIEKIEGELPWRWHTEKPDESMVDPIWDNNANGWVENDPTSKTQIIANLQDKVETQDKQLEQMNKNQETSLTSISKNQAEMLKMMAPLLANGGKPNV